MRASKSEPAERLSPPPGGSAPSVAASTRDQKKQLEGASSSCLSASEAAEMLRKLEVAGTNLASDLSQLTAVWKEVMQESTESAVDHMLLYDSAAMDLEAKALSAVHAGERLIQGSVRLNKELRGMDILAARVKAVKLALEELEALVKPLLR
mmetsp:Transcript_42936/g.109855  ORF Transcript_42936/g.109855 Transcript_42936/m.109855 type:complete len:152 (+) Transcript_42936:402-857(+)